MLVKPRRCRITPTHLRRANEILSAGSRDDYHLESVQPRGLCRFNLHILGGADPDGVTDHFMLLKDDRGSSGVFQFIAWADRDERRRIGFGPRWRLAVRQCRCLLLAGRSTPGGARAGRLSSPP